MNVTMVTERIPAPAHKITGGASYSQVIGDVKHDVQPNDEYSANYLISNAVNIYCPAQLWQLRNTAGGYVPPPQ